MLTTPAWIAAALACAAVWLVWRPVAGRGLSGRSVQVGSALVAVPAAIVLLPPSSVALLLVGVAAAGGALLLSRRRASRRGAQARSDQVQRFCEELAAELSAGLPVGTALDGVAERWPELSLVASAARLGGSVPETLRDLATRPGAGDLRLVAAAWHVAQRGGAGLALALESVAGSLAERQRTRRLVASELASARATARLMALLPLLTLAMGSGAGGDPVAFLLATSPGLVCLAAGCLLALAGLWWIEAIATGVEAET
jgi:tight adherence protein B